MRLPGCTDVDLVPSGLTAQIDALNDQIYDKVPAAAAGWLPVDSVGSRSGNKAGSIACDLSSAHGGVLGLCLSEQNEAAQNASTASRLGLTDSDYVLAGEQRGVQVRLCDHAERL